MVEFDVCLLTCLQTQNICLRPYHVTNPLHPLIKKRFPNSEFNAVRDNNYSPAFIVP